MTAGSCSPVRTRPPGRTAAVGRSVPRSCGTAGVSTCCARPPLRYGPPGDTPSAPRLRWQLWALRPGLDGASRPSTTLTGRGGTAGFGARRTGTAVSGLQPVSARPTAPGGNRRRRPLPRRAPRSAAARNLPTLCGAEHCSQVPHESLTGARTDPPETSSPEVCSFQLPQVCSFRLLLTAATGNRGPAHSSASTAARSSVTCSARIGVDPPLREPRSSSAEPPAQPLCTPRSAPTAARVGARVGPATPPPAAPARSRRTAPDPLSSGGRRYAPAVP